MEAERPDQELSQFSLRTLMLAVGAAAMCLAFVFRFLHAGFLRDYDAVACVGGLLIVGAVLPALWAGALRRLGPDALFLHIGIVPASFLLLIEAMDRRMLGPLVMIWLTLTLVVPSMAWYMVARMERGPGRERVRRWTIVYAKNALQYTLGLVFFFLCFMAMRLYII
jgi:hypothetical protein